MRRVVVISEHVLFRHGIAELLKQNGHSTTELSTYAQVLRITPHAVVLDLDNATEDAQELLIHIGSRFADSIVVVVGTPQRLAASSDGVAHVELESSRATVGALLAAVRHRRAPAPSTQLTRAHRRWASVTPRQREVLRWLAIGLDNRGIGVELKVTSRAIKAHVSALLVSFGLESRTDLALLAQAAGARPPVR